MARHPERNDVIGMETNNFANMLFRRLSEKITDASVQAICAKHNLKELPENLEAPENIIIVDDFFTEMHKRENNLLAALLKIAEGSG
jgi:hypothetical protein